MTEMSNITVGEKAKSSALKRAATLMSKAGSSKGGIESAKKLTAKQRKDRARKAINTRWKKKKQTS